MKSQFLLVLSVCFSALYLSCTKSTETTTFQLVSESQTGISFANTLTESDSIHYFNFPYIYTGAGVGIADFNNDGLQDVFFAGNMVSSRLYINQGDLVFKDLTTAAGVKTARWVTGVSCIDINNDGWKDIYVCVGGFGKAAHRENLLFINNHNLTFTESAQAYGINDDHHSTQAAFLDYDRDGDLDLYVMEHANESYQMLSKLFTHRDGKGPSTDRLFQNEGMGEEGHPIYKDVSDSAGILIEGYGLGLAVLDINDDNWPDIYIANDYLGSDLLYINNQDGTFSNKLEHYFDQCSRNAMGIDVADLNNDAMPDIFILDMLPQDNERQKTMTSKMNYNHFTQTIERGFAPQFIRNTLQLNAGKNPQGEMYFQEVGRLAGLHQTDWSWGPLIADFDNDGLNDIYITNGIRRDVTNHDFQEYTEQRDIFQDGSGQLSIPDFVQKLMTLDAVDPSNYLYKNLGDLAFEDRTKSWGLQRPSLSNGSAYADLDNDGDLEIIVNNIDEPAFIYQNNTLPNEHQHFLKIGLHGPPQNRDAIGAKISLHLPENRKINLYQQPVHGYMSSIATPLHVGLGNGKAVDSMEVQWPNGLVSSFYNLPIDTLLEIRFRDDADQQSIKTRSPQSLVLKDISDEIRINYRHLENKNNEFRYQPLLLNQYDNFGPGLAVSSQDEKGYRFLYIGGARRQPGTIIQVRNDQWITDTLPNSAQYEDLGALFLDIDGDHDQDLYVVSGGSSVKYFNKGHYQDRIYVNTGQGKFILDKSRTPTIESSGSCVIATDFDGDADLDLFVGGRLIPGKYPQSPESYLLINERGVFIDRTDELAPGLRNIGMVSSAIWTDVDNDLDQDLFLVGEWLSPTLFIKEKGKLVATKNEDLDVNTGWWNSIAGGDFDRDGDIDYIAGNLGTNSNWKTSHERPLRAYVGDFDNNATVDAIFSRYIGDSEYPIAPRGALIDQIEPLKFKFPSYQSFAESDMSKVLEGLHIDQMMILEATFLESAMIENLGNGRFSMRALPMEAQMSPIYGININDFDGDGYLDVITTGNNRQTEVISGWHNAQKGLLLTGDGRGGLTSIPAAQSGFFMSGDGRALVELPYQEHIVMIASRNNQSLRLFESSMGQGSHASFLIDENHAIVYHKDGKAQKIEQYRGQGFLSQSNYSIHMHPSIDSISFYQASTPLRTRRIVH